MSKRLVVIGGVAGGTSAAAKAKRTNKEWEIHIFEKGPYVSYGGCGLPYFVGKEIEKKEDLIVRWPHQFEEQGIRVSVNSEVKSVDTSKGEVEVFHAENGTTERYGYDSLVIATGARPFVPPIPGVDLDGVYVLRTPLDGEAIRKTLGKGVKEAVVVGGGFIGVEMCEALLNWGVKVTMIELMDQILPPMDADIASLVADRLTKAGVEIITSSGVSAFEGDGSLERVIAGDLTIPAQLAVLAIGVRPNVELAKDAGVALGPTGAIAANECMETNLEGIFTAGDCAEAVHIVTGDPVYIPLGTTANKMGRVAGTNAVGGRATFKGVLGTSIIKALDLGVAMTGLTEKECEKKKIAYKVAKIKGRDRAHYYPGSHPITVKLVYRSDDGRLVGGQIVSHWTAAKRIDAIATAIYAGLTVEDFGRQDFAYSPPFSPVWDPMLTAANRAVK